MVKSESADEESMLSSDKVSGNEEEDEFCQWSHPQRRLVLLKFSLFIKHLLQCFFIHIKQVIRKLCCVHMLFLFDKNDMLIIMGSVCLGQILLLFEQNFEQLCLLAYFQLSCSSNWLVALMIIYRFV